MAISIRRWTIAPDQDTTGLHTDCGLPEPDTYLGQVYDVPLRTIESPGELLQTGEWHQTGENVPGVRYFARLEGQTSKPPALPDSFYVP